MFFLKRKKRIEGNKYHNILKTVKEKCTPKHGFRFGFGFFSPPQQPSEGWLPRVVSS